MLDEARDGEAHRSDCSRDNESGIFYHEPTYFSLHFFICLNILLLSGVTEDMHSDIFLQPNIRL